MALPSPTGTKPTLRKAGETCARERAVIHMTIRTTDHSHERSLNERGTPTLSEALFYGTYLLVWISNIRTASTVRWTGAGQRGTGDIENVFR